MEHRSLQGFTAMHPFPLAVLTLVLLPQFSLVYLVFVCHAWSKQTTNTGTLHVGGGLWAAAHHVVIDNYKNLTVAQPFLGKEKPFQTQLVKCSLEYYTARNTSQIKILSIVLNVPAYFTPTAALQ